ncbi:uncharacterized protein HMPREF1541_08448 [Cyphellophora europaea CBS 101466]|uniref:Heterokaryon incompatibility domain-containing protein n=1 Tax=Cyphellophora europaea (strain CBS 101466) TaxID=1220924 RepID=W2RLW5_CYPE1|nr:uncharacterized protein HMPREF1541_08448 [Cyphellophora europaea CBS 101466]ETN37457.1 hypothetical protein HMPREF1541_08448 [Cyphellophora europaea CBS 101466]
MTTTTATRDIAGHVTLQAAPPVCEPYQYGDMPEKGWIRVLLLEAGAGPLCCNLRLQRIDDVERPFEALSYVWGIDGLDQMPEIECDGKKLRVGSNLASALARLRRRDSSRAMWADAICINQADKQEKSLQVLQMGDIYAAAERVVVWLGDDATREAEECFRLIERTTVTLDEIIQMHGSIDDVPPLPADGGPIASGPVRWASVKTLMANSYLTRTWTLQETGLAQAAVIQWGHACMNWAYLVELMLLIALRSDIRAHTGILNSGLIWDTLEDLWRVYNNPTSWRNELPYTRSFSRPEIQPSFVSILNNGRYFGTTDPRDHVYAFLSHPSADNVARDSPGQLLTPDYNASVDQVYLDTAVRILETDPQPWTVLSCSDHAPDSKSMTGHRPSWVPRWDEGFRVYWLGYPEMWYRAGGPDSSSFTSEYHAETCSLHLRGVLFDTITWASEPYLSEELTTEQQLTNQPLQRLWNQISQTAGVSYGAYGSTPDEQEHAFSLAIVAGRAADDSPAEDDSQRHRAVFHAYRALITHGALDRDAKLTSEVHTMFDNQRRALHNRRFFRTSKGYYGTAHRALQVGDVCCVTKGSAVPFVLRPVDVGNVGDSKRFLLVGEAYIQGVMRGQVWDGDGVEGWQGGEEDLVLV